MPLSPPRSSFLSFACVIYTFAGTLVLSLSLGLAANLFSRTPGSLLSIKSNDSGEYYSQPSLNMSGLSARPNSSRSPVYFLSIGGPGFIGDTKHPAFQRLGKAGQEITQKVKPKAVVVFSAHWQHKRDSVAINVAGKTDIIYDFHGFPSQYYQIKYPNTGSPEVAEDVIGKLAAAGITAERQTRGLDHGVWAGFLAAFDPINNPLECPIIQVSLFDNEDVDMHYRLGQALQSLRYDNIVIIGAGMAVHNLSDFRQARASGKTMPYSTSFEESLSKAVTAKPDERREKMGALAKAKDFRTAHPSLEHLLPIYVSAGAAGSDVGERIWEFAEGSLNWAQYRFGAMDI